MEDLCHYNIILFLTVKCIAEIMLEFRDNTTNNTWVFFGVANQLKLKSATSASESIMRSSEKQWSLASISFFGKSADGILLNQSCKSMTNRERLLNLNVALQVFKAKLKLP